MTVRDPIAWIGRLGKVQARSISIFIGIKQYVPPVIFIVTTPLAQVCNGLQCTNSLAHLYGTNDNIFGRAHFDKSKGE